MDKRGILRIIEAVVAIVIVIAALVMINRRERAAQTDLSDIIPPLLMELAQDPVSREKVLCYDPSKPRGDTTKNLCGDDNAQIITDLKAFFTPRIKNKAFKYDISICDSSAVCPLAQTPYPGGDIYSAERVISATIANPSSTGKFAPKKVKIFLWR